MASVLVVDDEKSIRITLSAFLRAEGYGVETAQDVDEAVRLLEKSDFDVAVTDIVLPKVSGMDLLERIRDTAPHVQVIIMTGEPTVETATRALRAGALDYLLKPVRKNAILRSVANASRIKALEDEQRRLEEENRQYQEHLEEMVEKQTEELRDSREKYLSILENVCIGISLISPEMKILELNRQMREWFPQATVSEGSICYGVFNDPPRDEVCSHCPCVLTLRDGQTHESMTEQPCGSSTSNYRIVSSPIRDSSGGVTAVVKMMEDITERKKMEDQLRHAQKMEAVGQLAGGVAHDFNNVLQVMLGYACLTMKSLPPEHECYRDIEEIHASIIRATSLTRQLLIFSRRDVVETKDLDLNEVIANVLKMLRRVIGEDIALEVVAGSDLGTVHADPGRMEQILMNLCINARDAMPHGGAITITTEDVRIDDANRDKLSWAREERYVLTTVSDNGCGMSPEVREKIFEPFFTTKEEGKGTGLGLATVHDVVAEHDGRIEVLSEVGKGTTFEIYLPSTNRSAAVREREIAKTPAAGGRERILLAEDDDAVRAIGVRVLERAGYTVRAVPDGAEAIRVIETEGDRIDAAILDAVMPKKSGLDVYARIKSLGKPVPVLFCTGHAQNSSERQLLEDRTVELLRKPYANEGLLRKLRELLDRAKRERDKSA